MYLIDHDFLRDFWGPKMTSSYKQVYCRGLGTHEPEGRGAPGEGGEKVLLPMTFHHLSKPFLVKIVVFHFPHLFFASSSEQVMKQSHFLSASYLTTSYRFFRFFFFLIPSHGIAVVVSFRFSGFPSLRL